MDKARRDATRRRQLLPSPRLATRDSLLDRGGPQVGKGPVRAGAAEEVDPTVGEGRVVAGAGGGAGAGRELFPGGAGVVEGQLPEVGAVAGIGQAADQPGAIGL